MLSQFSPDNDIQIIYRNDKVRDYMSPDIQERKPHFHYQHELLLSVSGSAEFEIVGQPYRIAAGSILFMSNMENHAIRSSSRDYARYTMRFSDEVLLAYLRDPLLLSVFRQRPDGFLHEYHCSDEEFKRYLHLSRLMEKEYAGQADYWDQMIVRYLMTILINMYRKSPRTFPAHLNQEGQSLIFNVQNYIESHLQEELSLDAVSARFFIDKYHLSHTFSKATGYTFRNYIVTARISKAKDLLLNSNREIRDISEAVGFKNVSHFIRTFRKMEDTSPLQYRNRAKKRN